MKKLFIMLLGILLISTALAITQNVTVTVTGEPSIILGAEPDGDDEIDDDGLVFASLDSNFGVHCKIKWEDVWEDIEASQTQDNYTFYDDGTYEIKYRCYDSLENYLTGVDTITLFRVPPEIYIHSPEDGSLYEEEEILINISTSRTTKEIRYSDNGRPFRLLCKNCSNVTILNDFGDGHHSFVVKITDLFNRNFFEEIEFDVDSAPPRIKSISPKNGEYTNGTFTVNYDEAWVSRAILFWKYAYETDYHNVTKFDCPSGMDKTCQITKEFEGVEGIEVDFYFEIHNAQGHDRSGVNRVTIDTIIPVMEVFLPVAGPLDKKQVYFNITINEIVDLEYKDLLSPSGKWKSLCKNCEEYGNSKKKYKTFNNGPYNLLIRAKDNAENQDTEMVEIFVDSKAPQILGFTPEDGEIIPRSLFEIEYTEEEFVERIELYWKIVGNESYNNKTLNDCPTGRRQTCSTKLNLTEYNNQSIEFFFKISDIASSTASEIATVEIDNDLPQVAINSPIANKNYGDTKILLDIEIDEMVETLEYKNMKDKNPRFRRLCHNCDSYNRIKSFEEG
ncbi:MAG: hypothetical protein KJ858_04060, partial [Nanoarchaeota archaeon]|nr:hypothetical protein [Nanoarchaeota archaeon]